MYTVYADNNLLYHPNMANEGLSIYEPSLTVEKNKAGSFKFTMPATNPSYNDLTKMKTIISVFDRDEEIFRGRILNDERDFYNNKVVYCEGQLAFLLDSVVEPYSFNGTIGEFFSYVINAHNSLHADEPYKLFTVGDISAEKSGEKYQETSIEYTDCSTAISSIISKYGGCVRLRYSGSTTYIDWIEKFDTTNPQVIRFGENLLDLTHYISAENLATRLIPLGATYSEESSSGEITPGRVLVSSETRSVKAKNWSRDSETNIYYTFKREVIFNDANQSTKRSNITVNYYMKCDQPTYWGIDSWGTTDARYLYFQIKIGSYVKRKVGLSNWIPSSEYGDPIATWTGDVTSGDQTITCSFVNTYSSKTSKRPVSSSDSSTVSLFPTDTKYTTIENVNDGIKYIDNTEAINLFGLIIKTHIWDDVSDPGMLMDKAQEYLANDMALNTKIEINALDLHILSVDYSRIKMGDTLRVISRPHGLDKDFECTKVELNLMDPSNNVYTLGVETNNSLTEQTVTVQKDVSITTTDINDIYNNLDYNNSDLVSAVSDAVAKVDGEYEQITITIDNLGSTYATIDFLNIGTAAINNLVANTAWIEALHAQSAFINALTASTAVISQLTTNMLDASTGFIGSLTSNEAFINSLTSNEAFISNLSTNLLTAGSAFIEQLTVSDAFFNNIMAESIKADALKIKGTDGLYYSLNVQAGVSPSIAGTEGSVYQTQLTGGALVNGSVGTDKLDITFVKNAEETYKNYTQIKADYDGIDIKINTAIEPLASSQDDLANRVTATENNLTSINGYVRIGTIDYENPESGVVEPTTALTLGQNTAAVKAQLVPTALNFVGSATDVKYAWIDAYSGLGASSLSIGAYNLPNKWKVTVTNNGTRFRITK